MLEGPALDLPSPPAGFSEWAWVVVNSSGGKDSQTALRAVVRAALRLADGTDRPEYPLGRIVVSHQDLTSMEWEGTKGLAQRQAEHYGLRFEVSEYRNAQGDELELLEAVRRRGKWPDNNNRYCTSDFKRGPGGHVLTMLGRERPGPILHVFGFRSQESPARRKRPTLQPNARFSTPARPVVDWLPIQQWTDDQVWSDIESSAVESHSAYALGMPRLSCVFCIFAPKPALILAGRANRELLDRYCAVEAEIGHRFRNDLSLREVRDAIIAGEKVDTTQLDAAWNM